MHNNLRCGFKETMDLILGSDHAGFDLKEAIKGHLLEKGDHQVKDIGAFSRESIDYPAIAHELSINIQKGTYTRGILICGSGIGMSITANRHNKVRAALCHNLYTVSLSRRHNDANVLVLGGRLIGVGLALEMVDMFLEAGFEGGRHQRRRDQIDII